MTTKTKMGMFLMTGLVLAVAAIYSMPMQQATACGCGKSHGGGSDGGSLINVEDNKVGSNNGNVKIKTGDTLSGNKFLNTKALNNNNIGNLNDVNVLSKNGGNKFLSDINVLNGENKFLSDNDNSRILSNLVKHNDIGNSILTDYYKKLCTC